MREGNVTVDAVVDAVAEHYAVTREHLLTDRRLMRQRRVARYLACRFTWRSLPQIGTAMGGVSNTNILAAKVQVERKMAEDATFAAEVGRIKVLLRGA